MGDVISRAEERRKEREESSVKAFLEKLGKGTNLIVDNSIRMFCSLASSENLTRHYEKRKMETDDCTADWIKSLMEKLGGFTSSPELAGLGVLAIAIFIDTISATSSSETTKDALRCVFAEEKASEVWDQIDECLKRCMMNFRNNDKLRSDIERIECQLSAALTRLKNSMVRDGHMSSQALRAWVNGAAFHIQMLIHLVRLGGIRTCDPVERLLATYLSDLDPLFRKHKEMITGKCRETGAVAHMVVVSRNLVDEDSKVHPIDPQGYYPRYLEAYYEHRYNRQKEEIQKYFTDVRQNLQQLVHQRGSFNIN